MGGDSPAAGAPPIAMAAEAPAGRPGAYTNSILLHPPPVLNILVLDIVNLHYRAVLSHDDAVT